MFPCTIHLLYYLRMIWYKSLMMSEKNLKVVCLSHTILCKSVFCNDGHLGFQIRPMYNTLVQDHYYNKWIVCGGDALYMFIFNINLCSTMFHLYLFSACKNTQQCPIGIGTLCMMHCVEEVYEPSIHLGILATIVCR